MEMGKQYETATRPCPTGRNESSRHVPQLVHRIEQRVLLNDVVDLHVGTQRTRLVEVLELRHLLGSDVIDNGHGASNHGNAETNDPSHIWAISNIKPQRFSL